MAGLQVEKVGLREGLSGQRKRCVRKQKQEWILKKSFSKFGAVCVGVGERGEIRLERPAGAL